LKNEIKKLKGELLKKDTLIKQCHNEIINNDAKNEKLKCKMKVMKKDSFCYKYVCKDVKMHHYYTGIKREVFEILIKFGKF